MNSPAPKWLRWRAAAYMRGKGLCWGATWRPFRTAAHTEGVFSICHDVAPHPEAVDAVDSSFDSYKDESFDWVWIGRRILDVTDPGPIIAKILRKLRFGGHAMLQTLGEKKIELPGSWQSKGDWTDAEGWFLQILKKQRGKPGIVPAPTVSSKKRACVVRYGAIGDMIIVSPVLRRLAEDGYEVTVNCQPYAAAALDCNPFVSNLLVQERDVIPNPDLGPYWDFWRSQYDLYINLSESLEGSMLKVEGRKDFFTHKAFRQNPANYYHRTLELAGYPSTEPVRGELFFRPDELRRCEEIREQFRGKKLVLWGLKGSSFHKCYPMLSWVAEDWKRRNPDSVICTLGDPSAKNLDPEENVVSLVGKLSLREAMAMPRYADLVVSPESMLIHAAGTCAVPKITLLSHSTHENVCSTFLNDYCLAPEAVSCHPCMQLHYTLKSCPLVDLVGAEDGAVSATVPVCSVGISPQTVLTRMEQALTLS